MGDSVDGPVTLEQVYYLARASREALTRIECMLEAMGKQINDNAREIAVLKDWRATQMAHTAEQVTSLRVEMARYGALGGGLGVVVTIIAAVLKAMGVF